MLTTINTIPANVWSFLLIVLGSALLVGGSAMHDPDIKATAAGVIGAGLAVFKTSPSTEHNTLVAQPGSQVDVK